MKPPQCFELVAVSVIDWHDLTFSCVFAVSEAGPRNNHRNRSPPDFFSFFLLLYALSSKNEYAREVADPHSNSKGCYLVSRSYERDYNGESLTTSSWNSSMTVRVLAGLPTYSVYAYFLLQCSHSTVKLHCMRPTLHHCHLRTTCVPQTQHSNGDKEKEREKKLKKWSSGQVQLNWVRLWRVCSLAWHTQAIAVWT